MNREYERRLSALETSSPTSRRGTVHQIVWGVGQSWDEVVSAHNDGADIRPGDHVLIYGLVSNEPDPLRERERSASIAWLQAKGVVSVPTGVRPAQVRN